MKHFKVACLLIGVCFSPLYASERLSFERAVESEFASVTYTWGVEFYDDPTFQCDVIAEGLVRAARSFHGRIYTYECEVCLVGDDNGRFDYNSISCDYAR